MRYCAVTIVAGGTTVTSEPTRPTRRMPESDDFPTGTAVGERFPDFTLRNQRNEEVNLTKARSGQRTLLVFHRSTRW